MSGEREQTRAPFNFAEDFDPSKDDSEPSIPLMTPFQRYMVDGMRRLFVAQGEFTGEIASMKQRIDEMAPHVQSLKNDAALLKKVLTYGKYVAFGLATRYFPEFAAGVAKHAPAIIEAAGKAAP